MKKYVQLTIALITWFAVITQYVLMIEHRVSSIPETTVRFFSFFTILTNTLVALYMSQLFLKSISKNNTHYAPSKFLTPLTVYITIVGLIYQLILRQIWNPQGIDKLVDELLHTIIPLCMIIYWYFDKNNKHNTYKNIPIWLIYPIVYLLFILIRGHYSEFYPYPFINVSQIGMEQAGINALFLILFFIIISCTFIFLKNHATKKTYK